MSSKELLTPRGFLKVGGVVLLVLGLLGMVVLGPTPQISLFNDFFWLDQTENWAHLVLGLVALFAYFSIKDDKSIRNLVVLVGSIAALAAVVGMLTAGSKSPNLGFTNLEMSDNLLHAVVAIWAFSAIGHKVKASSGSGSVSASSKKSKSKSKKRR